MARRIFDHFPHHPLIVVCLIAVLVAGANAALSDVQATRSEVTIVSATGQHSFQVEVMRTPDERARGLMFRKHMAAEAGMLFDFGADTGASMWMKNTFIPLDMLFIKENGTVANIAADTVPHSLDVISATSPVRYVLEVNAGTATKLGIKAGDQAILPRD